MTINQTTIFIALLSLISSYFPLQAAPHQQLIKTPLHHYNVDTTALSQLYHHPDDYFWLDQQRPKDMACDALAFIARASDHGLDPESYHYSDILQLDSTKSRNDARLYDRLLTDGLVKLIHDISIGKLDPGMADPKWFIPRETFDASHFLQQALITQEVKTHLDSLLPASSQYQQMQQALIRYQHYVDCGGWAKISNTPVLRPGDRHPGIIAIRQRLNIEENTPETNSKLDNFDTEINPEQGDIFDPALEHAVKRFQQRHSLKADGIIGPQTLQAMNVPASERLEQIKINLERLRWLPDDLGERYIMVNVANYRLIAVENDQVKLTMRVIVGRKKRPTPSFSSTMTTVVFNPYWHVPRKLARLDILPKQKHNASYLHRHNIHIYSLHHGITTEVSPAAINWQSVSIDHFPYILRQDPGDKNALGRLKFLFPNPWSIYLHDTPHKSLFNKISRNFSSGCIRVENPMALAGFTFNGHYNQQWIQDMINKNTNQYTKLQQPVSVYAVYLTVWQNNHQLIFSPDSYKRDQKMARYL